MGKKVLFRYRRNPHQDQFHSDVTSKYLHLSGGYGCVRESTLIETEHGPIKIKDLRKGTRVWSVADDGSPVLTKCEAPYVKGIERLYRVTHEAGEFVAHGLHLICDADGNYQYVQDLCVGQALLHIQPPTTSGSYRLKLLSNAQRLMNRLLDFLICYQGSDHSHDQQPLLDQAIARDKSLRLLGGLICIRLCVRSDVQEASSTDIRREQSDTHPSNPFDVGLSVNLSVGEAYCSYASHSGHTLQNSQPAPRFQLKSDTHPLSLGSLKLNSLATPKTTVIAIEQLEVQEEYWDMYVPETNNYIAEGTVHHNSGKTYALCMKAIQLSVLNKDMPGGLIAPDFSDLEKDVLPAMEDILRTHRVAFDYRAGRHFQFPWTKSKLYLASGKKRIRGPNWAYACINEVTLLPYVRYQEIIARVRLKRAKCPQIASSGTPEGFGTDYHEHLIEKPFSPSVRVIYGSTFDNAQNLSPDYVQSLESSFDSVMLDAYLKGLFVNMVGNRFYYAYDYKNEDKTIPPFDGDEQVHIAMDFNVEHMTATVWRYDGYCLRGIEEIVILNNADTRKMCMELKRRGYLPDNTIIYPDPSGKNRRTSGASDVEIIRQEGFKEVRYKPSAPPFRRRQLNCNNLFEKKIVKIHPDRMPTTKRDFLAVTQDPTTNEKLKDNPKLTHASDGFDYMVDYLFPFSGKRPGVLVQKYR